MNHRITAFHNHYHEQPKFDFSLFRFSNQGGCFRCMVIMIIQQLSEDHVCIKPHNLSRGICHLFKSSFLKFLCFMLFGNLTNLVPIPISHFWWNFGPQNTEKIIGCRMLFDANNHCLIVYGMEDNSIPLIRL